MNICVYLQLTMPLYFFVLPYRAVATLPFMSVYDMFVCVN